MRILTGFFFVFFMNIGVMAQTLSHQQSEARNVINQQVQAFRIEDSSTAYRFAAPNIKSLFPTADIFMAMVKRNYDPIYNPLTYSFGEAIEDKSTIAQSVFFESSDGVAHEALYQLMKQSDGSWKITSVHLRQIPSVDT